MKHFKTNPFKDHRPGNGWSHIFLKWHPKIGINTSKGATNASLCISEKNIRRWFMEIREYALSNELMDVLDDPNRVFKEDETSFQICPSTGRVLSKKGEENVYIIEKNGSEENLTVLFSFSATFIIVCIKENTWKSCKECSKIFLKVREHFQNKSLLDKKNTKIHKKIWCNHHKKM